MKRIGRLLGPPKSLKTDPNGNLYYIIPRDNAIVRWNGHRPIKAERHDVIFQISGDLVQIIFGARGSVWAVTSLPGMYMHSDANDHCIRIMHHFTTPPFHFASSESDYDYDT